MLLSRPFWIWGAEMGTNEHGVTIGNEAVFTRQRYAKIGLTGMDLLRLALERSTNADEAIHTIVSLIERYGQGGGCGLEHRRFTYHNSFIVADPRRALVLETAGRQHAVEEVRGGRSISNGLTIPGFAERHSDKIKTHFSACRLRRERTQRLVDAAVHAGDLMRILRDHGSAGAAPEYSWVNGGLRRSVRTRFGDDCLLADHRLVGCRSALRSHAALGHRHRGALYRTVQARGRRGTAGSGASAQRSL